jgi:uncharacterized protein (TIGR03067 family)
MRKHLLLLIVSTGLLAGLIVGAILIRFGERSRAKDPQVTPRIISEQNSERQIGLAPNPELAQPLSGTVLFAPAPFPKRQSNADGLADVQGTWDMVSYSRVLIWLTTKTTRVTASFKPPEGQTTVVVIAGDQLKFRSGNATSGTDWRIVMNANRKPGAIDIYEEISAGHFKDMCQGIYKVEQNILTICYAEPGEGRPTEFTIEKGNWLVILKRQQP